LRRAATGFAAWTNQFGVSLSLMPTIVRAAIIASLFFDYYNFFLLTILVASANLSALTEKLSRE
jgi:hypothetical protein